MTPVIFSLLETTAALKYLRAVRSGLRIDMALLEEKLKSHGNGPTQGALLALAAEVDMLDSTICKLWQSLS